MGYSQGCYLYSRGPKYIHVRDLVCTKTLNSSNDLIVIALARASPTPTCNVLLQQFSGFEAIETRRELCVSRGEVVNQSPKI
jgi:hypothetical protein